MTAAKAQLPMTIPALARCITLTPRSRCRYDVSVGFGSLREAMYPARFHKGHKAVSIPGFKTVKARRASACQPAPFPCMQEGLDEGQLHTVGVAQVTASAASYKWMLPAIAGIVPPAPSKVAASVGLSCAPDGIAQAEIGGCLPGRMFSGRECTRLFDHAALVAPYSGAPQHTQAPSGGRMATCRPARFAAKIQGCMSASNTGFCRRGNPSANGLLPEENQYGPRSFRVCRAEQNRC